MKIRTLGALAALGMSLTSYSVWSLTSDTVASSRPNGGGASDQRLPPAGPAATGTSFSVNGTLGLDARVGHARLPRGDAAETFVLVNLRADANATGLPAQRHLTIAIDRSGSMAGKRLANAVAAAQGAVRRLADGDRVSVIDYASTAHVLVQPTTLDASSRERVSALIGALGAGGETCISCALDTALSLLQREGAGVERVLLLSDGEATTGVRDIAGMRRMADNVRATGATVTTIGVDVDYNERMMTAIAQATNGRHYFVASPEGLSAIFDQELSGLERAVARDVKVELELAPNVELVDVAGRSFQREGSRVVVALGSFSAGEERTVLARVRVRGDAAGQRAIATARVVYDDLASGTRAEKNGELALTFTDDGSRSSLDPEVLEQVQRSGSVTALNDANELFSAGDAAGAQKRVTEKLDEVRRGRASAVAAAPAPRKAVIAERFAQEEAALGAAASAFAEPPPASAAELRESKAALKQNAAQAADLAF